MKKYEYLHCKVTYQKSSNHFVALGLTMLCTKVQQFMTKYEAKMPFTIKTAKFLLKAIQTSINELKWLHNIKLEY